VNTWPEALVKPPALRPGDRVAIVASSWGGPSVFPRTYEAGLRVLRDTFGLEVVEMPSARLPETPSGRDPRARAESMNLAFADPSIRAIVAAIGGDDSVRILPWLDLELARRRPAILLGFSDTTTQLVAYHLAGLVTYYGPSVMAGFAQLRHFPDALEHVRSILFGDEPEAPWTPFERWVDRYQEWSTPAGADGIGPAHAHDGWHWLQGEQATTGRLFGGCIDVLEWFKGTPWWPNAAPEFWTDRVLFLETSEEKPSPTAVRRWLRGYGVVGAFDRISALWFGRAYDYTDAEKAELDQVIVDVVAGEFGATTVPIVTNLDFGHTGPQWVLPLGIRVRTDPVSRTLVRLEAPTAPASDGRSPAVRRDPTASRAAGGEAAPAKEKPARA
jgi:muramoyltetrapeptide carboxypeptidase LdcA involved in peptidoglycan recycling